MNTETRPHDADLNQWELFPPRSRCANMAVLVPPNPAMHKTEAQNILRSTIERRTSFMCM